MTIGPICLPIGQYTEDPNEVASGSNGIIAGWGARNRITEAQSQMLQWIRLPFVDNPQCATFYANYTSSFKSRIMISSSQLCIQGRENGKFFLSILQLEQMILIFSFPSFCFI